MAIIEVDDVEKSFAGRHGSLQIMNGITFSVADNDFLAIVGPSGCGKSTLLYMLGGLERPTGRSIVLEDAHLDRLSERGLARLRRTAVGFVFQAFHLIDELTARENVELPALLAGKSPRFARRRALTVASGVARARMTAARRALQSAGAGRPVE